MEFCVNLAKTIKLFLMDGDPNGRISCELSNWNGKAYRIPRSEVKHCTDRSDLTGTCVYFLFAKADSAHTKPKVYIGEAENALSRLKSHVAEKEFWSEAVVFISKDDNLNKAHIKHLESKFYQSAIEAERYDVENANRPTLSAISESDQAEMVEFALNIKLLLGTLGFKVLEPLVESAGKRSPDSSEQEVFYLTGVGEVSAQGHQSTEGFVVYKDSIARVDTVASLPKSYFKLRGDLIKDEVVERKADCLVFKDNYLFSSPSAAATVLLGRSANGLIEWKTQAGTTLKEHELSA